MKTVTDLCAELRIELKGDDGQPYHCGTHMHVKGGIIGPDYAKCETCGITIGNLASPHVNGGGIPSDEWIAEHGNATWERLDGPVEPESAEGEIR